MAKYILKKYLIGLETDYDYEITFCILSRLFDKPIILP